MFANSPMLRWRQYDQLYKLQGNKCIACSKCYYPNAYVCTCGSRQLAPYIFAGTGTLLTFTQITVSPVVFESMTPYCIGLVKLDDGPQVLGQIADVDIGDLKIGMKMQAQLRKLYVVGDEGTITYGIKFVCV